MLAKAVGLIGAVSLAAAMATAQQSQPPTQAPEAQAPQSASATPEEKAPPVAKESESKMIPAGSKIFVAPMPDGFETYVVAGRTEGQPPLRLYLDKESGLLLRLVRYAETPLGRNPTQIDYADYRDANGVKAPFRWILARSGNRFTIQVEQLQQNVPVDDSKFAIPPPAAQKPSTP